MRESLPLILILLLCGGCASTRTGEANLFDRYSGSRQLARATTLLQEGDATGAAGLLTAVCNAPGVAGVTDEALFRLALLTMKTKAERPASAQAQRLLRRLKKEYPASQWTLLAAPVTDLVNLAEEQKRQNRALRANNQSLNHEIEELNQRIEQLKHLDQELEKKSR